MLSRKGKYGLKALIHLAKKGQNNPCLISSISEAEHISKKFLEAILLELKKSGFLGSKMGKGGGYYLLKSPDEITLASVYRTLEGPISLVPCVSLNYYEKCTDCEDEASCELHNIMIELRDSTLQVLENKTIKDFL